MKNGQVALGLAGGYFLGRAHKMRWALALAGLAAGSRLRPGGGAGTKLLASPEINKLTQTVRNELLSAGKTAAVAAAGSRIDSLSDRMQRRASSLRAGPEAEKPENPEDNEEEPRDEEEEEEEEEPGEEEKEEPAEEAKQRERGRPARTRAPSSKGRTRTPATRPATDKKKTSASSSKSASRKTTTGRRTASSGSSGSGGSARRDRG
ncbi:hypothetical protein [Streptomyces sp. NPDC050263]|uniref:hypothetical protein n=1 Tax=Streptomyces sp. NPDC050263 TaxID=3155037 RepID=UPI003441FA6C